MGASVGLQQHSDRMSYRVFLFLGFFFFGRAKRKKNSLWSCLVFCRPHYPDGGTIGDKWSDSLKHVLSGGYVCGLQTRAELCFIPSFLWTKKRMFFQMEHKVVKAASDFVHCALVTNIFYYRILKKCRDFISLKKKTTQTIKTGISSC